MTLEEIFLSVLIGCYFGCLIISYKEKQWVSPYPGKIEKCFVDDAGITWCYTTASCWYDDMGQEVCTSILAKKEEK
jgi:hypothetical protein